MENRKDFVYYFVPAIVCVYFFIALMPRIDALQLERSIFPFSCFDLYSLVPNKMVEYDVLLNLGKKDEHYLYFGNENQKRIAPKFLRSALLNWGSEYDNKGVEHKKQILDVLSKSRLLDKNVSAHLVRLTGKYSNTIADKKFEICILYRIE